MRTRRSGEADAVLAARSALVTWLMTIYMRRLARRHFHAVRLARGSRPVVDSEHSVIIYSNHPSWWDPVICVLLQAYTFPRRAGYGPMDSHALRRYGVLRRMGVFGMEPGTRRGAVRFLRVSNAILEMPDTALYVTAEGGFTDARLRPVRLRLGVAHLLHKRANVVAIPLALEFPFWNESKPEALARFGDPIEADISRSVEDWDTLLTSRLTETMNRLAQDAMTRDASRFDSLVSGKAGMGGIYDVWRRFSAAARGKRAQLAHEPQERTNAGYPVS